MCVIYVLGALVVITINASEIPRCLALIMESAFTPVAEAGACAGVSVWAAFAWGLKRACFSNEAGEGSAAMAHAAAKTDEPVREGVVAGLGPFIDTIIICTMTGLVVVVTGQYLEAPAGGDDTMRGVLMTSAAFESVFSWFPGVLALAVFLFAFSTMISWSYYGERCWVFLFGKGTSMVYRVIFLVFVVLGSILNLGNVVGFSDLMILGMAFPNILGLLLLNKQVANALDDYWERYKSGKMAPAPRRSA
jgi:AGCS family alanine or glycine:cation symporter